MTKRRGRPTAAEARAALASDASRHRYVRLAENATVALAMNAIGQVQSWGPQMSTDQLRTIKSLADDLGRVCSDCLFHKEPKK